MQDSTLDIIIAGAGLGGTCAALYLSDSKRIALLSGTAPAASTIAAGLVNPFAGQRMGGFWNAGVAYEDFLHTLCRADALETYNPCGILRPALSEVQASLFQAISLEKPDSFTWLQPDHVGEMYPSITAPFGAAITKGGVADIPQMLDNLITSLIPRCTVIHNNLAHWEDHGSGVSVILDSDRSLKTKKLILAVGAGYQSIPKLRNLNLHCTKGQLVHVSLSTKIPLPVSGYGYAVPIKNRLILGTTYEHAPRDPEPTEAGIAKILALIPQMIPSVASAKVLSASAGIRVGVPGTRLPMVGPLTSNVWILTGLGSKGLLLGSHIGRNLENWMTDPSNLPDEFRVQNN